MVKFSRYISNMTPVFRIFRSVKTYLLCASIYLGWQASSVYAHPHMWVDLDTQVELTAENKVTAIHQRWLFDDFFSAAILEEAASYGGELNDGINAEVGKIINNLHAWDYFTEISVDGMVLDLKKVETYEVAVVGDRVLMSFTTELLTPADPLSAAVSYSIYDPTYYIEMFHFDDATIGFAGDHNSDCNGRIVAPDPSNEAIALSQSAELDVNPDASVGKLFAEIVNVECR